MNPIYTTITGRKLDLGGLDATEREFLTTAKKKYEQRPEWSEFASWWYARSAEANLSEESLAVRICDDLEARLGIAQGMVAPPDYRDYLADLIEERYGSTYRFCKETGVDPGHLSRVFASRADLSIQSLKRILDILGVALIIRPREKLKDAFSPEGAAEELARVAG